MKTLAQILLVASSLLGGVSHLHAQGTAFTYQGRLHADGGAASGSYDFRFQLASDALGNNYLGSALLVNAVPTSNGLFTATLDFGGGVFSGGDVWLQVDVKTNGAGSYTTLTPLQAITPTPYAITASNLSGTLPAAQLSGTVPDARLAVNLARTNQVWLLDGNAATTPGTHFLGTIDDQSLELRVNGSRALRLDPNPTSPNVIGGYVSNSVSPGFYGATIAGGGREGFVHTINAHHGTIGGGDRNTVSGEDGTIAGGGGNIVAGNYASVGGGLFNNDLAFVGTIAGGRSNTIQFYADAATIGGGCQNTIQPDAQYATISGGVFNTIQTNANFATISGGYQNTIQPSTSDSYATIGGGGLNAIQTNSFEATIGGGYQNTIQTNAQRATIGGGYYNTIQPYATYVTIGGGGFNTIQTNAGAATIGGGFYNTVQPDAAFATIGGGRENTVQANAQYAAIGGGYQNTIETNAIYATIAGGEYNTIQARAYNAAIGGGYQNTVQANAFLATIGGGYRNTIQTNALYTTIGGGYQNTIQPDADFATIGGGYANTVQPGADYATIGGGAQNAIQTNAVYTTVGGGTQNTIQTNGNFATIGGGIQNTIQPFAVFATIPGGYLNSAASYAFAAGYRAKANHTGAFVWGDSQDADFASTGINQFCIRANGGVQLSGDTSMSFGSSLGPKINLYSTTFGIGIQNSVQYSRVGTGGGFGWYAGGFHNDNTFDAGGGLKLMTLTAAGLFVGTTFVSASDRNMKENFAPVQPREMLEKVVAMPLSSWNYKADTATRHLGPMAQDFYAAFNIGPDDKHIATVDADGVALAAIQGLNEKVEVGNQRSEVRSRKLEQKLEQKETEITELKQRLDALEKIIQVQSSN